MVQTNEQLKNFTLEESEGNLITTFTALDYECSIKLEKEKTSTKLYQGIKNQTKFGLNYSRKRLENNLDIVGA